MAVEVLKNLLYPYEIPSLIIHFEPSPNLFLLTNGTPYLIGLHSSAKDTVQKNCSGDYCIYDLDNKVKVPPLNQIIRCTPIDRAHNISSLQEVNRKRTLFQVKSDYATITPSEMKHDLPRRVEDKLKTNINNAMERFQKKKGKTVNEYVENVRYAFFDAFINIWGKKNELKTFLKHYEGYIYSRQPTSQLEDSKEIAYHFQITEFLKKMPEENRLFIRFFVQTKTFTNFIRKAINPRNRNEKLSVKHYIEEIKYRITNKRSDFLLEKDTY